MKLILAHEDPARHPCQALVVGCCENEVGADALLVGLDAAAEGLLSQIADFTGKANKTLLIHTWGKLAAERLLLVGLGKRRELTAERLRQSAGAAAQALRVAGLSRCASVLHRTVAEDNG